MNRLAQLHDAGVSIWLDSLSRELLEGGGFAALVAEDSVTGATSNPTIFAQAITTSGRLGDSGRASRPSSRTFEQPGEFGSWVPAPDGISRGPA